MLDKRNVVRIKIQNNRPLTRVGLTRGCWQRDKINTLTTYEYFENWKSARVKEKQSKKINVLTNKRGITMLFWPRKIAKLCKLF